MRCNGVTLALHLVKNDIQMTSTPPCPLADQIALAIDRNELQLPSMPDWAMKVLRLLDDMDVSINQVIAAVGSDPAFAAKIIRVANSAVHAEKPRVDKISAAVPRVGFKMLRNLIVAESMSSLARVELPPVKKHLNAFWTHSHEVAAVSYILAKSQKHLNPEQAMLAGLTHDIGVLPLLLYIDRHARKAGEQDIEIAIRRCAAQLGEKLLRLWHFPDELLNVPVAHENLYRDTGNSQADYADIITVANMLKRGSAKIVKWENIAAVKRIGIHADVYWEFFDRFDADLRAAREMLSAS